MTNNIDIILDTINTLILQQEDAVYFIGKGAFHSECSITKITECWYDPTLEDLDNKLKEALRNQGLTQEEIDDEIAEFHDTEFYKKAKDYLREDENEEDENNNFEKPWDYGRHFIDLEEELELPTAEIFELENFEGYKDDDELQELILDFLSGKYGFCVNNFSFRLTTTHVIVENIKWDTTE